jgi:hypothetical protein
MRAIPCRARRADAQGTDTTGPMHSPFLPSCGL